MKPQHYVLQTPELTFSFLGTLKAAGPDTVWLCKPDGQKLLLVPTDSVKPGSPELTAARLWRERGHPESLSR